MKCLYDYVGLYFNKLSRISLYLLHVFLVLLCFAYYMIGVVFIDYEPCYMRHQQLTLEKIVEIKQYFFFAYFPFILLSLCVFALMLINIITEQTELKIKYKKNYSLRISDRKCRSLYPYVNPVSFYNRLRRAAYCDKKTTGALQR